MGITSRSPKRSTELWRGSIHHMDAKVGGNYKMSLINFTTGHSHSFGGTYRELTPYERIRYKSKFDDPK